MTNYAAGTRFEHRVRTDLRERGFTVIRSAGSKSKVDLVAVGCRDILLVQCKRAGALAKEEWDILVELATYTIPGVRAVLAVPGPLGRGLEYIQLIDPKIPGLRMARQPVEVMHPISELGDPA